MPDQTIVNDYFSNVELELEPFIRKYLLSDKVIHALSKGMALYEAEQQFKFLRVNSSGELLVSLDAGQVSSGGVARVTVTNVATLIRAANAARKEITIYNEGTADIYLGLDNAVSSVNGILLPIGMSYTTQVYTGDFYGIRIGAVSPVISVMEF